MILTLDIFDILNASHYKFRYNLFTILKRITFIVLVLELLDVSLGDLEESLHINFMIEFGWLCAQYYVNYQK